ncbi:uncharacterized protein METZ01_LOCUS242388 [marine metagenome]|uniref:Uncharacterized protein n=1 Tax=marine metagenome TaxID=408172 RepID=A0A382HQ83_9ZZZZ
MPNQNFVGRSLLRVRYLALVISIRGKTYLALNSCMEPCMNLCKAKEHPPLPLSHNTFFSIRTVSQSYGIGIVFLFMKIEIKTFCFNLLGQSKQIMKKATLLLKEKI